MSVSAREWREALESGVRLGLLPKEALHAALEEMAARPPGDLTPALVAFWVDLEESQVSELLRGALDTSREVAPATAPATEAGAGELSLRKGERLGEFVLGDPLGAGGMGQVFAARQVSLARDVALKVLSPALAADPEGQRRFLREARCLASISHPRVVTCYQVGTSPDGLHFIAMELMTGGDAWDLARKAPDGKLDEQRALELTRDAAQGLVAFEQANLVHRDLKPQNLFLTAEGRAKLGDLGLARSAQGADRMTLTGVAVGTLPFMAPEQLDGAAEIDARADVYALGATLYTFLAGKPPRVNSGPPQGLSASPRTVAFVRRAMALDPERRYPSARAALEAVEAALASLQAPAPPSGKRIAPTPPSGKRIAATAEARRPAKPNRLVFGVASAACLLAGYLALSGGKGPAPEPTVAARPAETAPPEDAAPAEPERPSDEPEASAPGERPSDPEAEPSAPGERPSDPEPEAFAPDERPSDAEPVGLASEPRAAEGPTALRGLPIFPGEGLEEVEPGLFRSTPDPNTPWHRSAVFDVERRSLPLRVRWTVTAEATRDAAGLEPWERGHGFVEPGGFFFELGLRTQNLEIQAARELGPAWWVCLTVRESGRVLGLVRQINAQRPGDTDLIAVPQPGLPRVPGVDVVGRFRFQGRSGLPLDLDLDADRDGWRLVVRQAGQQLADLGERWSASRHAPIRGELDRGVYLWSHLGNSSSGAGTGTVRVALRE